MNTYPSRNDIISAHATARSWDAVIEEDIELELQADRLAHASLSDHLHDLGCNAPLMAWANDDAYLDVSNNEEGIAVYASLAAALDIAYKPAEDDRSAVNAWLAREYRERFESLLESSLTLAA